VHVTLRAALRRLRSQFVFPTLRLAIARATRRAPERFRIVEFSVQSDHVHLIVEAADKHALSTGVRGVLVRIARYVNDLLGRKGRFWADRWHCRALKTPREVRNAIAYVLGNFRKHAPGALPSGIDPYSSARWFEGYAAGNGPLRFAVRAPPESQSDPPVSVPRTWLLSVGWRRRGLLRPDDAPRS
jgi:REP element-mobilizing transposase RayT